MRMARIILLLAAFISTAPTALAIPNEHKGCIAIWNMSVKDVTVYISPGTRAYQVAGRHFGKRLVDQLGEPVIVGQNNVIWAESIDGRKYPRESLRDAPDANYKDDIPCDGQGTWMKVLFVERFYY